MNWSVKIFLATLLVMVAFQMAVNIVYFKKGAFFKPFRYFSNNSTTLSAPDRSIMGSLRNASRKSPISRQRVASLLEEIKTLEIVDLKLVLKHVRDVVLRRGSNELGANTPRSSSSFWRDSGQTGVTGIAAIWKNVGETDSAIGKDMGETDSAIGKDKDLTGAAVGNGMEEIAGGAVGKEMEDKKKNVTNDNNLRIAPPSEGNMRLPKCPDRPPALVGFRAVDTKERVLADLEKQFSFLGQGGSYSPPECQSRDKVAVIIPYRNRWQHLLIFLYNIIPFLVRQQVSFTIFVIEQLPPSTFNRALLLNVGLVESAKLGNYTCYVFHDVDLVPLNDRNLYRCGSNPRHLAVGMNKFKYELPYLNYVGGVVAISKDHLLKINGNSNVYFGWGGEDDDMFARVKSKGLSFVRYSAAIGRYDMIEHTLDKGNEVSPVRMALLSTAAERLDKDGLTSLVYHVQNVKMGRVFTWVHVSINETEIIMKAPEVVQEIYRPFMHKPASKEVKAAAPT